MIQTLVEVAVFATAMILAFGLAFWANRARTDRSANVGLYLLFGIPGGLLTVAGLALLVNGVSGGWLALGLGLGLGLPLVRPARVALAQVTPVDPNSPIDLSGLSIILAVAAYMAYTLTLPPVAEDTDGGVMLEVNLTTLIINVLTFAGLAYIAVGFRNWRSGREATERLGLTMPTPKVVLVGLALVIPSFMLSAIGSLLTTLFQPEIIDNLDETIEQMTSGVQNPIGAIVLGLSTGIGEELLFRGAIQPRFGIVIASGVWALLHTQYQLSFVVLGLFALGIMLGLERKYFGTTAAVITHAVYNMIVVLLQIAAT